MTIWYLSRAAGLTALVALSVSTALGAWVSSPNRAASTSALSRRYLWQRIHLSAALTGLGLLAVHVISLILDTKTGIWPGSIVVPMASAYRPMAVTAGVLALYIVAVVTVAGGLRGRLASSARLSRAWRATHALAYGAWALAIGHGIFAGTDTLRGYVPVLYAACVGVVAVAVVHRVRSQRSHDARSLARARRRTRELTSGLSR